MRSEWKTYYIVCFMYVYNIFAVSWVPPKSYQSIVPVRVIAQNQKSILYSDDDDRDDDDKMSIHEKHINICW